MLKFSPSVKSLKATYPWWFVGVFFTVYLIVGLTIYRNYGLSWDEVYERNQGEAARDYILGNSQTFLDLDDRYYGQFFNVLKIQIEYSLKIFEFPEALFFDHLMVFLLFYLAVGVFFLLGRKHLGSWQAGLLSSAFLVLSPVIFSHSFYNPKDIPFLAFFTFSMFTLSLWDERPTLWMTAIHALFSAAAIGSRIPGLVIPAITLGILFMRQFLAPKQDHLPVLRAAKIVIVYLGLLVGATILLYPAIWLDPWGQFILAFKTFQSYTAWNSSMLFMGRIVTQDTLPWYYLPVWIAVTTPPLYLGLFAAGLFASFVRLIKRPLFSCDLAKRQLLVEIAWFFVPLLAIVIGRSIVYDSWRHVFFIYPALLLIAVRGLLALFGLFWRFPQRQFLNVCCTGAVALSFAFTIIHIVRTHPLEYLYFNFLAGPNLSTAAQRYELDYWGLSFRPALEHIYRIDPSAEQVIVKVSNRAGQFNEYILPSAAQAQIVISEDISEADYYVTNAQNDRPPGDQVREVYAVTVGGLKIAVVYRLR